MAETAPNTWSDAKRRYADAMQAEVDWAPLHFNGWSHYEQARPLLSGETIEVIARWPEQGYTLQYRPLLGELTEARQIPIDPFPEVTVLGRIDGSDLPELQAVASCGLVDELSDVASQVAKSDKTIPIDPPVRTGSTIPAHEQIPVHYIPTAGRLLEEGHLIHEDHPSAAYAVAGHWGIRLGPAVGLTPTGLLVFQPAGMKDLRITVEHPVSQPVDPKITEARVGLYRYDGLGQWQQTATITQPDELPLLGANHEPARAVDVPFPLNQAHHG
ncbi:MAG: hypothetical protein ACLFRT_09515 [Actinomycetota bacterium]